MQDLYNFYINGAWIAPQEPLRSHDVIDPSTEGVVGRIALGSAADVDMAVKAAQAAFETFGKSTVASRVAVLERVIRSTRSVLSILLRRSPSKWAPLLGWPKRLKPVLVWPICRRHWAS
jgi:hypothetical protein